MIGIGHVIVYDATDVPPVCGRKIVPQIVPDARLAVSGKRQKSSKVTKIFSQDYPHKSIREAHLGTFTNLGTSDPFDSLPSQPEHAHTHIHNFIN